MYSCGPAVGIIHSFVRERRSVFDYTASKLREATTQSNPKFKDQLEFSLAEGKAVIVTGLEETIDPSLYPILENI